jgi:hypothetical protein
MADSARIRALLIDDAPSFGGGSPICRDDIRPHWPLSSGQWCFLSRVIRRAFSDSGHLVFRYGGHPTDGSAPRPYESDAGWLDGGTAIRSEMIGYGREVSVYSFDWDKVSLINGINTMKGLTQRTITPL